MAEDQELNDWIKEIEETKEQLGRLVEQLKDEGMIGRIEHLQIRLDQIKNFLGKLNV